MPASAGSALGGPAGCSGVVRPARQGRPHDPPDVAGTGLGVTSDTGRAIPDPGEPDAATRADPAARAVIPDAEHEFAGSARDGDLDMGGARGVPGVFVRASATMRCAASATAGSRAAHSAAVGSDALTCAGVVAANASTRPRISSTRGPVAWAAGDPTDSGLRVAAVEPCASCAPCGLGVLDAQGVPDADVAAVAEVAASADPVEPAASVRISWSVRTPAFSMLPTSAPMPACAARGPRAWASTTMPVTSWAMMSCSSAAMA